MAPRYWDLNVHRLQTAGSWGHRAKGWRNKMATAEDYWEVRGLASADAGAAKRWSRGLSKVGVRLETHFASVLVSLTAEGVLTLRLADPDKRGHGSLMLMGRLAKGPDGQLTFRPSHPNLGFGVEINR